MNIKFFIKYFLTIVAVFVIHISTLSFLKKPIFDHLIILSYVINFLLAIIVLVIVEKTMKSKSAQSGFVFMAGSALKFLVFFLVFYPTYKEDGEMKVVEFTAFFIPYAICLIIDVLHLSKQLNNQTS